jgi:AcrR family transcriptional regulator
MVRGRPRTFNINDALESALHLFWQRGYEGTSVSDLTEAMGISSPSLYAAFGNKEELFYKVLDHYAKEHMGFIGEALQEPTARAVIERWIRGTVDQVTNPNTPPGCLTVQGALSCGVEADTVRTELNLRRATVELALRERLEQAKTTGELRTTADTESLARYITTITQGMAVKAGAGASRIELHRMADVVLQCWPS